MTISNVERFRVDLYKNGRTCLTRHQFTATRLQSQHKSAIICLDRKATKMSSLALITLALACLASGVMSFKCLSGNKINGVGLTSEQTCFQGEKACFAGLFCGKDKKGNKIKRYSYSCISASKCNGTGNIREANLFPYGKGVCCLTENCNKDLPKKCTSGAKTNTISFLMISVLMAVAYRFYSA